MNLALCYLWKEWRAQRATLIAYALLVFTCLAIGLSMAPSYVWREEGFGVHAVSWFFAAGVIGVVGFVMPALVRGEYAAKDDLFVRRLPGALRPAFHGKLLFVVLAALLLPLCGLLVGELFVMWRGADWKELFVWGWRDEEVFLRWPTLAIYCGFALLLAPWVWAIGTWLPGGRMAVGGALLFALLIAVCVFAVLRQSPNIEQGLAWQNWLWLVPVLGFAVAAVSWIEGRRGGGPLRSARFGLAVAGIGLLPPAAWLGERAWRYHHPDPHELAELNVIGCSPDGRYMLAHGNTRAEWLHVPFRIDLTTGQATQLAGVWGSFYPEVLRPGLLTMSGRKRWWHQWNHENEHRLFDLVAGTSEPIGFDAEAHTVRLDAAQQRRVVGEARDTTPLRLSGGEPVWPHDGGLWRVGAGGSEQRVATFDYPTALTAAGHAVRVYDRGRGRVVDLATGATLAEETGGAFLVRDVLLHVPARARSHAWHELRNGETRFLDALSGCKVLGLVDDDRVLCVQEQDKRRTPRLFVYRPADGGVDEIALPTPIPFESVQAVGPLGRWASLLSRDPGGRVWLRCSASDVEGLARLDIAAGTLEPVPSLWRNRSWTLHLLDWPDADRVVLREGAQIVRVDVTTGAREVLFPR